MHINPTWTEWNAKLVEKNKANFWSDGNWGTKECHWILQLFWKAIPTFFE